jgi:hypothetical protein
MTKMSINLSIFNNNSTFGHTLKHDLAKNQFDVKNKYLIPLLSTDFKMIRRPKLK